MNPDLLYALFVYFLYPMVQINNLGITLLIGEQTSYNNHAIGYVVGSRNYVNYFHFQIMLVTSSRNVTLTLNSIVNIFRCEIRVASQIFYLTFLVVPTRGSHLFTISNELA